MGDELETIEVSSDVKYPTFHEAMKTYVNNVTNLDDTDLGFIDEMFDFALKGSETMAVKKIQNLGENDDLGSIILETYQYQTEIQEMATSLEIEREPLRNMEIPIGINDNAETQW